MPVQSAGTVGAGNVVISVWNPPGDTTFNGKRGFPAFNFLDTFRAIASTQNWSPNDKLRRFPLYLQGYAKTWMANFRTEWKRDPANVDSNGAIIPMTWDDLKERFEVDLKSRLTEDKLEDKLAQYKYNHKESVEDYCGKVMRLMDQLDRSQGTVMKENRRIKFLSKGLNHDVARRSSCASLPPVGT
jgi:hypothetical protein